MPLIDLVCSCGFRYEGLKSFSTLDPDLERCPRCGLAPSAVVGAGVYLASLAVEDLPADEMAEHLEAKRYYESEAVSRKVLSGEISLKERGPRELRPVCPEGLRKRYF